MIHFIATGRGSCFDVVSSFDGPQPRKEPGAFAMERVCADSWYVELDAWSRNTDSTNVMAASKGDPFDCRVGAGSGASYRSAVSESPMV